VDQWIVKSILRAPVLTILLLYIATNACADTVGTITEQTGPVASITRNKASITTTVSTPVEMEDAITTANVRMGITFKDDSKVQITEQSKLVIDSFVFDNTKQDAGKLSLKVALGTARFASGQIAKHTPENLKVETPTATVGVRGTDFTLTVDEIGRSLIILLPSCPTGWKNIEKDCVVGEITVTSDQGMVIMNQAFQATVITAREQNPSKPAILKLSADQINNMLIVTPPKEVKQNMENSTGKTALDFNALDKDLLKYTDLDTDMLTKTMGAIDINYLDTNFLFNMLDFLNASMLDNLLNEEDNPMLPKFKINNKAGLKYTIDAFTLKLYRTTPSNYAEVNVDKDNDAVLILKQDDLSLTQQINKGNGTQITIRQGK
jgi:hypothetical protein